SRFAITSEYAVRVKGGRRVWTPASSTEPQISAFILTGGSVVGLSAWVNGVPLSVGETIDRAVNTVGQAAIGSAAPGQTDRQSFAGSIAEAIVSNRALPTSERNTVEPSLAAKYAISG